MIKTKITALILVIVLITGNTSAAFAADCVEICNAAEDTAKYLKSVVPNPSIGSIGGEWSVLGLARSGYSIDSEYFENYFKNVTDALIKNNGVLHSKKNTEYSRVILALAAIGKDPQNVAGYNLLLPLGDFEGTIRQGLNGPIWAIIALDSKNYKIPQNREVKTEATKDMYIEYILKSQSKDGGWELGNQGKSDADITGMVLQALSRYQDRDDVKRATDKAINFLSSVQTQNGGYASDGVENAESAAQVIVALCSLGVSITDERFVKNGVSVLDNLMSYYERGKGFKHTGDGSGVNLMSTEQGFYAIVAYLRSVNGETSLYDMSDVKVDLDSQSANNPKPLKNRHKDVNKNPVINPNVEFSDILLNKNKDEILALAQRGVINGKTENVFDPDGEMTRAEFATIVVKALGLPKTQQKSTFVDVNKNEWYSEFVSTAYSYGIVNGTSTTSFTPNGTISKEEAAVMTERAAKLCGIQISLDRMQTQNILAAFTDYLKAEEWAMQSLAFCYNSGILNNTDTEILPKSNIKRCEIAKMLYNLLTAAKLM